MTPAHDRLLSLARVQVNQSLSHLHEAGMIVMILTAGVVFTAMNPAFASIDNFLAIVSTVALVGIVAVLSTHVVIAGGFDLSVGSLVGAQVVIAAQLLDGEDSRTWWVLAVMVLFGVFIGLVNGLITTMLKVPSFITTLGMMLVLFGAIRRWTGGAPTGLWSRRSSPSSPRLASR